MYEIFSSGESCYKSITLRELLQYVNETATNNNGSADDQYPAMQKADESFKASKTYLRTEKFSTKPEQSSGGAAGSEEAYDVIGELRLRDLRRLDFQYNPNEERSVLIRRHAVLFAMVVCDQ